MCALHLGERASHGLLAVRTSGDNGTIMATLTLRNVPDALVDRLKIAAVRNGRSVDEEAIAQLEEVLPNRTHEETARILAEVRSFREGLKGRVWATDEDIDAFINEGRE